MTHAPVSPSKSAMRPEAYPAATTNEEASDEGAAGGAGVEDEGSEVGACEPVSPSPAGAFFPSERACGVGRGAMSTVATAP